MCVNVCVIFKINFEPKFNVFNQFDGIPELENFPIYVCVNIFVISKKNSNLKFLIHFKTKFNVFQQGKIL